MVMSSLTITLFSSNAVSEEKNLTMVYSDRFSPIVSGTSSGTGGTVRRKCRFVFERVK